LTDTNSNPDSVTGKSSDQDMSPEPGQWQIVNPLNPFFPAMPLVMLHYIIII